MEISFSCSIVSFCLVLSARMVYSLLGFILPSSSSSSACNITRTSLDRFRLCLHFNYSVSSSWEREGTNRFFVRAHRFVKWCWKRKIGWLQKDYSRNNFAIVPKRQCKRGVIVNEQGAVKSKSGPMAKSACFNRYIFRFQFAISLAFVEKINHH